MPSLETVPVSDFGESGVMLVPWTYLTLYQMIVGKRIDPLRIIIKEYMKWSGKLYPRQNIDI